MPGTLPLRCISFFDPAKILCVCALQIELRAEARAPFRFPRIVFFGGLAMGASLGLLVIGFRLAGAIKGALGMMARAFLYRHCRGRCRIAALPGGKCAPLSTTRL